MSAFDSELELFRTCHSYESDMLAEALDLACIPYYRYVEDLGGIRVVQFMPAAGGIGVHFVVVVPAGEEEAARAVLEGLPITAKRDLGIWGFNSSPGVRAGFRAYAWMVLAAFGAWILIGLVVRITSCSQ